MRDVRRSRVRIDGIHPNANQRKASNSWSFSEGVVRRLDQLAAGLWEADQPSVSGLFRSAKELPPCFRMNGPDTLIFL